MLRCSHISEHKPALPAVTLTLYTRHTAFRNFRSPSRTSYMHSRNSVQLIRACKAANGTALHAPGTLRTWKHVFPGSGCHAARALYQPTLLMATREAIWDHPSSMHAACCTWWGRAQRSRQPVQQLHNRLSIGDQCVFCPSTSRIVESQSQERHRQHSAFVTFSSQGLPTRST